MRFRHAVTAVAVVAAAVLSTAPSASAIPAVTPVLVHFTQTSLFTPPSPDPMGITYVPWTNHLLITDSEVEEMPGLYTGKNLFETTLDGTLVRTGTTQAFSIEPTDVTVDPATHRYYFSDDDGDRVWTLTDGPDHLIGNGDDVRTSFSTRPFNATDIEGIAFAGGNLYVTDGLTAEVFRIKPGNNGVFDGVSPAGDDVVSSFNVASYGVPDPEGIEYNPARSTLSIISNTRRSPILELSLSGALIDTIDMSAVDVRHGSGLTFAPASADASRTSAYVTDRGVDNDFDPTENDGRLYELLGFGGPALSNQYPLITNPGTNSTDEGASASLQIKATDADGPSALSYAATGLPPGLSIAPGTGLISGTPPVGASVGSPYTVDVTVSDGPNVAHMVFPWNVRDKIPPAAPTGFSSSSTTRALVLDWDDNIEPDLVGYLVERAASSGGPYTMLTVNPIGVSAFADATATPGATSYYRITAVDGSANVSFPLLGDARRISIAFRDATKATQKKGASITVAAPVGTTSGDVLVASVAALGSANITPPSGWTPVTNRVSGTMRVVTYIRTAGGGEPVSYRFDLSVSTAAVAAISGYSGVAASAVDTSGGTIGTGTTIIAPSVSPSGAGVLVGIFGIATAATITSPAVMLENVAASQTTGNQKVSVEMADQVMPSGATGSRSAIATKAAANAGLVLVLTPA